MRDKSKSKRLFGEELIFTPNQDSDADTVNLNFGEMHYVIKILFF